MIKASKLRDQEENKTEIIERRRSFSLVKASRLREQEQSKDEEIDGNSPEQVPSSLVYDFIKPLTTYLTALLVKTNAKPWSRIEVWQRLRESYIMRPCNRLKLVKRKHHQIQLFKDYPFFPNPLPYSNVSSLVEVLKCQNDLQPPERDRVYAGEVYHQHLQDLFDDKDDLQVQVANLTKILAEVSVQTREQFIEEPALNLVGRIDHLLLTNEGFVVREDKLSSRQWASCYLSAIFQVHLYAFILQSIFPKLPCRALQICVHIYSADTAYVYTFAPDWEWFIPHLAYTLLPQWNHSLQEQEKKLQRRQNELLPGQKRFLNDWAQQPPPICPSDCHKKGDCPLATPFPVKLIPEVVSRDELEILYEPAGELRSDIFELIQQKPES